MTHDNFYLGRGPHVEAAMLEWDQVTLDGRKVYRARARVDAGGCEAEADAESTNCPTQALRLAVGRAWLRWWESHMCRIEAEHDA